MTSLHVVPSLRGSWGGPSIVVPRLVDAVAEQRGIEPILLSQDIRSDRDDPVYHPLSGAPLHLVPALRFFGSHHTYSWRFKEAMREICIRHRVRVVHIFGLWVPCLNAASRLCSSLQVPTVISTQGMLADWALQRHAFRKRIGWSLYQRRNLEDARVVVATSRKEVAEIRAVGLTQPVVVIPEPIISNACRPKTIERGTKRTALFLGRIHPVKGILELISAWKVAMPENWQLIIAGPDEGGFQRVAQRAIDEADLSSVIRFCGAVYGDEKERLFDKAELCVMPSRSENFGIAIAEALAHGVPVITTNATPWEAVSEYSLGWYVDLNIDSLSRAITEATACRIEELCSMGERGRAYIDKTYGMNRIGEKLAALYRWVGLGDRGSRDALELL